MDIWVGYLIWNCLALKSQQKPYSWKIHNGISYSGNRGSIFERYSCDLADSVKLCLCSKNRTLNKYFLTIGQNTDMNFLQSDKKKTIRFSYNRTKHRNDILTIGQYTDMIFLQSEKTPIWFSYNRTNANTIFLQSDKTPIWFSYNRTKHRYDFLTIGQNTDMIFVNISSSRRDHCKPKSMS